MFRSSRRRETRPGYRTEPLESRVLLAIPQGGELHVNTFTLDDQRNVSAAMDSDGDFVLTWDSTTKYGDPSFTQDGSGAGVYAQRYDLEGVPKESEFQVNTFTTGDQSNPSAAMDTNGDFVITWSSDGQDGDSYGVYARRYNSAGVPKGSEFRVNTYTTGVQGTPKAAMDASGNFVITWVSGGQDGDDLGVYARRYNSTGVAQGTEFRVNTHTASDQFRPAAAMDRDGDFVIAWTSYGQDGSRSGVYAQRYSSAGAARGKEFRVNTQTSDDQRLPSVAMDASGDFVIAWQSYMQDGGNQGFGVFAQRYNSAGERRGSEFQVNTEIFGDQDSPSVAIDADGDFVITWVSGDNEDESGQDGSYGGVYAQRYNPAGAPQGGEFRVNTFTTGHQDRPAVAMDAEGDFVIGWDSYQEVPLPGYDNRDYGVYAQRFGEPRPATLTDGVLVVTGTDGNDVIGLAVVGSTLVVTRNGTALGFTNAEVSQIKVYGLDGNDRVTIHAGVIGSYVLGGGGNDTLTGGDGNDSLSGASGRDRLVGGAGNDRLAGGKHSDVILGGAGNDRIYGDEANDLLDGGAGRDAMYGGTGNDTMFGGNDNDSMQGETGDDRLDGGNDNDRLDGGGGQDAILGGEGNDTITDNADNLIDHLNGGSGGDSVLAGNADLLTSIEDVR